ncbi:hypothetical protein [Aestuariivivens sediminis]|uniref:hypothetical protein n=1 Tax=Aestuariivivens sediminis TaxID=2913557 RepID=UPI001F597773|nr:hypothetical protein [Aestuariivivens sediminis]
MSSNEIDLRTIKSEIIDSEHYLTELCCEVYGWVTPMSIMNDEFILFLNQYRYPFTKANRLKPIETNDPYRLTRISLETTTAEAQKDVLDKA